MRKIIYFILFILFLFAVNFVMWFMHNRTINESLHTLRKQLAIYKIDLTYEDVFYTSFKAWDVKGVVQNVKLRYNNSKNPTTVSINKLLINSKPYIEHLEISTRGQILLSKKDRGMENTYEVVFHNGTPSIEVKFSTSLNSLAETFEDDETPQIFKNIQSIKYYDSGFELVDINKKASYLSVGNNKFTLENSINKMSKRYDLTANFDEIAFNPEFPYDEAQEVLREINTQPGKMGLVIDASFLQKPSDSRMEFIEKLRKEGKSPTSKIGFDSFQIIFNNVALTSSEITTSFSGTIDRQPIGGLIPYMDIDLKMGNYEKWLDSYFKSVNLTIEDMLRENPLLRIKTITEDKINDFKALASQFSSNGTDLSINLNKTEDKDLNISGRPVERLIADIQAIFFGNLQENSSKTKAKKSPKSVSKSKASNVAN